MIDNLIFSLPTASQVGKCRRICYHPPLAGGGVSVHPHEENPFRDSLPQKISYWFFCFFLSDSISFKSVVDETHMGVLVIVFLDDPGPSKGILAIINWQKSIVLLSRCSVNGRLCHDEDGAVTLSGIALLLSWISLILPLVLTRAWQRHPHPW